MSCDPTCKGYAWVFSLFTALPSLLRTFNKMIKRHYSVHGGPAGLTEKQFQQQKNYQHMILENQTKFL